MTLVLLIHVGVTWAMVGLIWTIQVLQYPIMAAVPAAGFVGYETEHQRRVSRVLAVFAPAEVVTALAVFLAPGAVPRWMPLLGGIILATLWIATATYFAPAHGRLAAGFDVGVHRALVRRNAYRTLGWSARGVLTLAMVAAIL